MPFEQFDRGNLILKSIDQRIHDISLEDMLLPNSELPIFEHPTLEILAERIVASAKCGATVLVMIGAHLIKTGASPLLIPLMQKGYITHLAMNGAGAIHDFELALIGKTSENVAKYIVEGEFGFWKETGRINEVAKEASKEGLGLGEVLGRTIEKEKFPFRETSLLAAGYRFNVPVTIHIGIGCDIIHQHPNCDGGALGASSYNDFLVYTQSVTKLERGVFLNFGSAVTGPEVYLKALSMARNVATQKGEKISSFTTAVFDLLPLEEENLNETPLKSDARYFYRPWKTILARTVAEGGESFYVKGEHRLTVSALYRNLMKKVKCDE